MNETPPPTSVTNVAPLAAIAQIGLDLVQTVATSVLDAFAPMFTLVARPADEDDNA